MCMNVSWSSHLSGKLKSWQTLDENDRLSSLQFAKQRMFVTSIDFGPYTYAHEMCEDLLVLFSISKFHISCTEISGSRLPVVIPSSLPRGVFEACLRTLLLLIPHPLLECHGTHWQLFKSEAQGWVPFLIIGLTQTSRWQAVIEAFIGMCEKSFALCYPGDCSALTKLSWSGSL